MNVQLRVEALEERMLLSGDGVFPDGPPNDPLFSRQYHLALIDAQGGWRITTGSPHVVVAVIDSGIDYRHEDLDNNIWRNPGEIPDNNIDDDGNGFVDDVVGYDFGENDNDPLDRRGHGTRIAGLIGAEANNGVGVAGVAPNITLLPLKISRRVSGHDVAIFTEVPRAIDYLLDLQQRYGFEAVISFATNTPGDRLPGIPSPPIIDAIERARQQHVLFVASAGNNDRDNDEVFSYPASYNLDNIISVAWTDRNDRYDNLSNYGTTTVDLAAPGSSLLTTVRNNNYSSAAANGTSFSQPQVAAVAALILSLEPGLSYTQVKQAILETVDPLEDLRRPTLTNGRLNVRNALERALELQPTRAPHTAMIPPGSPPTPGPTAPGEPPNPPVSDGPPGSPGPGGIVNVVPAARLSSPGVFDPWTARWYLRDPNTGSVASFHFGFPGWAPVVGDWNGDTVTTIGVVDGLGTWYLRNSNTSGPVDVSPFRYGLGGWVPLAGDWNGNGVAGIGTFDPWTGTWYLRNQPSGGFPDVAPFVYGAPGWVPLVGDWNGDGVDTIGAFNPFTATFYLRNSNGPGRPDVVAGFGGAGWRPVVGDWDGNGTTTMGVLAPTGIWYLRNSNTPGAPDMIPFQYGLGNWLPLAGAWHDAGLLGTFASSAFPQGNVLIAGEDNDEEKERNELAQVSLALEKPTWMGTEWENPSQPRSEEELAVLDHLFSES